MILLVDIDHTVADAAWRDHMMGEWTKYHSNSVHDKPITEMIKLVCDLQRCGWRAIGFTMRPDRWRRLTITWLAQHGLKLDELLMRMPDVWEPSVVGKCNLLDMRFKDHDFIKEPVVLLDDHQDVCHTIAKRGITVLQVHARKGERHGKENTDVVRDQPAKAADHQSENSGG